MINRVTVLTNPAAGHGNARHAAQRAISRFQQRGIEVTPVVGSDPRHTRQLLDESIAAGTDAVVVAGGDGGISLALQSVAQTDIPLGIIPAGTGNDHARAYELPTDDPAAAADIVIQGCTETVDLGRITHDSSSTHEDAQVYWFGTVMAAGFDSLVSDRVNRMRWPHGRMRYNLAMVAELSKLRPLPFRLTFDNDAPLDVDLALAAFGNTRSYGGGMLICPAALPSDGLLDVTMVQSGSRLKLIRLFPTVFTGRHIDLDEVSTRRAASIRVECPGINAYADGDYVGPLPVTVSAVPGALRLLRRPDSTRRS